jgi:hypothetical protein
MNPDRELTISQIPTYQIHNVLTDYIRRLTYRDPAGVEEPLDPQMIRRLNQMSESRRQGILQSVADHIVRKITEEGGWLVLKQSDDETETDLPEIRVRSGKSKPEYVFHLVDGTGEKRRCTITADNMDEDETHQSIRTTGPAEDGR